MKSYDGVKGHKRSYHSTYDSDSDSDSVARGLTVMTKIGSVVALSCFLLLCQQMRQIDSFATSLMPGQGKRNLASGNVYDAENELSKLWGKDVGK
ncbi:unnamed protein product [Porites lobata]|uniref:Uncharacterized protein n=1 Tax=Porites lobata TaxID=104759 RepID=A0ABN8NT65_9CNID|nr:unnamed protein product [Porites lobata]